MGVSKLACEVQGIWAWGYEDSYESLSKIPFGIDEQLVAATRGVDCAGPEIWTMAWTLRRQLWRDLVSKGRLDVIFRHDNEAGYGSASIHLPVSAGSVTFEATEFLRSDALYMNYDPGVGLFSLQTVDGPIGGWREFLLSELEFDEFDDTDLYEFSFRSVDQLTLNPEIDSSSLSWSTVDETLQVEAITCLIKDQDEQLSLFGEIVLGHEDVLGAAAAHPESSPDVWRLIAERAGPCSREVLSANPAVPRQA